MTPFVLSSLLIIATVFPLGLFVFLQNRKQWTNRIWFLYSISLTMWGVFGFFIGTTENSFHALWYWRIAMGLGIIWMPVLFYHFAYLYAPWNEKKRLVTAYVITFLLAISAFTPFYIPDVRIAFDSIFYAIPGFSFYVLTLWWFLLTGYSHSKLLKSAKNMPQERQKQIKYFIFASFIGYIGGLHDFAIIYGFPIYPWSNFLIVIYPFIMTYAMIKHGLFDIFLIIKKVFYTAILVGIIAWSIGGIGFVNSYFIENFNLPYWILPIFAGVLAVYMVYLFLENNRKADKVKQEFITVAAHKLRTPLTHIGYIADEMADAKTEQEFKSLAVSLKEANERLVSLINKLLDVTNLETQSEKYEFDTVDLKKITENVLVQVKDLAQSKKIKINFSSVDNPLVEGYDKSISFVIQSLCENSIIYGNHGTEVFINIEKKENNFIWSVKDYGIGILTEDIEKIFEKFFRGQNALQIETEGTGLALFMARNILKRHGGQIKVESEGLGKGTTFWFTLPAKK